jgi:trigger factor
MNYTRKNLSKNQIEVQVVSEVSELKDAQKKAIARLGKDVKVPGFRAGKAPENILAMHIGESRLSDETVNEVVNRALVDILVKEQIQPLDRPNVKVTKFVPLQVLEFTVELEIIPPVKLGGYMNLKAKKAKNAISDQDIDKVIEQLRTNEAKKQPVKREIADGDEVILDFTGLKNGKEFDGGKAKDYPLVIGSNSFIPGFEPALIGHKSGQEFDVPLSFPKDYHAKGLAGAKVVFKVKIHKVNEVKKPAVDDKFAAQVTGGQIKKAGDLRADIKRELSARAEFEAGEKLKGELLAELVKKSTVEAPTVLVDDQVRALEDDFRNNLKYRGMTEQQYFDSQKFKNHDDWVKRELRPQAEARVKNGLILAELAKAEHIEVTDAEIEARQNQIVAQYNDPQLKDRFNSPEFKRDLSNRIATEKALDKLVAYNS